MTDPFQSDKNPHLEAVLEDVKNRSEWNRIDDEILKRRRGKRKAKKTKPYPGAPNTLVPIVDDVTREKTDQEITMTRNAPLLAHFVALSADVDPKQLRMAEAGFDTYLRHILRIMPRLEEAMDTKNARGFAVFKLFRSEDERFGTLSDCEACDLKDVIVPSDTRDLRRAERVTFVLRLSERELKERATSKLWRNVDAVIKKAKKTDRDAAGKTQEKDALSVVANLIGLTTSGTHTPTIVVWEHYHYATAWDVRQDPTKTLAEGKKCCTIFSPDAPEDVLACFPWREDDTAVPLTPEEQQVEALASITEGRPPVLVKTMTGKDRPWPLVQARYENRSRHYYDTRGVGHLCMDDQIVATAQQNAKLVLMDYYQQPMLEGPNPRNGGNINFEPGSFLPDGVKFAQPPPVPNQFDFDVELHKRAAGRRAGAMSQYEFSGNMGGSKRVQKTATEISEESVRGGMVSSASVDRFNDPLVELYFQIWEDLKRLKKPLPIIQNNAFVGQASASIYELSILIIPAASAKTLNPDQQFNRAQAALSFLWTFKDVVPIRITDALLDVFGHWDPVRAAKWIQTDSEKGPSGQPPVYQLINNLYQAVKTLVQDNQEAQKQLQEHDAILERVAKVALQGPRFENQGEAE